MIQQVSRYLQKKLPKSFQGWTNEAVEDYVIFHVEHQQLIAVEKDSKIQAVVIGWPTEEMQVEKFVWKAPTKHGRFWYWDQIAAENSEAFMLAMSELFLRRPESVLLPSFGVRRNRIRSFGSALMIYKKGQEIYGNQC